MEGAGQASRTFDGLDKDVLVSRVHQAGLDILHGKPVASGPYDVIFDVETQSALFSVFNDVLWEVNQRRRQSNARSTWRYDSHTRLTLVDDPGRVWIWLCTF